MNVRPFVRRCAAVALLLSASAFSASAYTLIVAPARYSVLQVAFDLQSRTPAVLVSYQSDPAAAEPTLHAWNGSEWVLLTIKDYREGNFLQSTPARAVLIGDDALLPADLLQSSAWVADVVRIRDLGTSVLVNEFGHILKWGDADWRWFAKRYNLTLRDESEPRRKSSWYTRTGPLPDRPRIFERITQGKPSEPKPVPVVDRADAPEAIPAALPVEAPAAPPALEAPAPMPEAAPVAVEPPAKAKKRKSAPPSEAPAAGEALDRQADEVLKAFD